MGSSQQPKGSDLKLITLVFRIENHILFLRWKAQLENETLACSRVCKQFVMVRLFVFWIMISLQRHSMGFDQP